MFLNQLKENELKLFVQLASIIVICESAQRNSNEGPFWPFPMGGTDSENKVTVYQRINVNYADLESVKQISLNKVLNTEIISRSIQSICSDYAEGLNSRLESIDELNNEVRLKVAVALIKKQVHEETLLSNMLPDAKKALLFELYSLALMAGVVGNLKEQLLVEIVVALSIENFIAEDLFDAAKNVNRAQAEAHALITE
jgi:hypothetical protein